MHNGKTDLTSRIFTPELLVCAEVQSGNDGLVDSRKRSCWLPSSKTCRGILGKQWALSAERSRDKRLKCKPRWISIS
jgi:hypothetical protein